ncbi:sugar phosphate phosphatase [Paenibacillus sp. 32O-W]|uniref:Cof-type HAD-IIB family hydrolase n=1 Tax=Paenibacillus sp. 32O-W TaxID=1695218 RepID=UPI0007225F53|nr:Cof-type HAD-IIB family hydrolase [Paenibacillus sp. 32O-W]ALS26748.1 sugar phosphate phosphatase [Paenibacillus sp. 32O-W]
MGDYRLVALDMDGTLLNDRIEISKENEKAIHDALDAGVIVCFSTGRGVQNVLPFAAQLQLDTPMITVNGGEVWRKPHVLHRRSTLNPADIERMHRIALEHPEVWYWAYSVEGLYNKEKWFDPEEGYDSRHWLKFGYHTEHEPTLTRIREELAGWGSLEITNSSPLNLEINPKGVTKASGLRELCALLGLDMSQVVAVGDSLNDIAAIREAGLGVAMGNAQEAVKAAADVVTLTNEEDGVAHVIREYVLKG